MVIVWFSVILFQNFDAVSTLYFWFVDGICSGSYFNDAGKDDLDEFSPVFVWRLDRISSRWQKLVKERIGLNVGFWSFILPSSRLKLAEFVWALGSNST